MQGKGSSKDSLAAPSPVFVDIKLLKLPEHKTSPYNIFFFFFTLEPLLCHDVGAFISTHISNLFSLSVLKQRDISFNLPSHKFPTSPWHC